MGKEKMKTRMNISETSDGKSQDEVSVSFSGKFSLSACLVPSNRLNHQYFANLSPEFKLFEGESPLIRQLCFQLSWLSYLYKPIKCLSVSV